LETVEVGTRPRSHPDFIKQKFAKYDGGILGLAVQAAVDRGIISDDEAEELL
jgi:hypothetical protein